ncbi:MAG: ABC transporter permease [Candidatus Levybacteria bacterium]|nr:ABC transporter permease [Candidatus Levybacteria bacterium]
MNINRIMAMVQRYFYNVKHSYDRLTDMFYWPMMDLLIWGLTGLYFAKLGGDSQHATTVLLTGIIFWIVTWRAQYEITTNLLSEMWDRNLVNIFASPLTVYEWISAVTIFGGLKMIISLLFSAGVAFLLYQYAFLQFGLWLFPIVVSLVITGWAAGFVVAAIIIRFGMKVQTIAWAGAYLIAPFSALYYPISVLPDWAQKVALIFPSSYIFEAMRQHIFTNTISVDKIVISFAINLVFLVLSICLFVLSFNKSKQMGLGRLI